MERIIVVPPFNTHVSSPNIDIVVGETELALALTNRIQQSLEFYSRDYFYIRGIHE
jgi:hypothetical protein